MISDQHKPILQDLREALLRGGVVAFIGAGTSMRQPAEVPGWRACFDKLCNEAKGFGKVEEAKRAQKVARATDYDPRYLTVAFSDVRDALGETTYHRVMQDILRPRREDIFSDVVEHLVTLPFAGIITTNIDNLLEQASILAVHQGQRTEPLRPITDGTHISQLVASDKPNWLWKIHGTIDNPRTWIFTAEEYWQSIYGADRAAEREIVRILAQTKRLLFVGFGGNDPDLNRQLDHLARVFGGQARRHLLLDREVSKTLRHHLSGRNIDVLQYAGPADHSSLLEYLLELRSPELHNKRGNVAQSRQALRDWVKYSSSTLDLRRFGATLGSSLARRPVGVDDVFIHLYERCRPGRFAGAGDRKAPAGSRVDLEDTVLSNEQRCVLLLGPGGSGKSTILKHTAMRLLQSNSAVFPVYVRLPELLRHLRSVEDKGPAHLCRFVSIACDETTFEVVESWVNESETLWLLDGFDELLDTEEQEISLGLVRACIERWPKSRFVIASRPTAALSRVRDMHMEVCELDALDDDDIRLLVEKWVDLLRPGTHRNTRQATIDSFLSCFETDAGFRDLSRTPAMLTAMLFVYLNGRIEDFPKAENAVLETVTSWLLSSRRHAVNGMALSEEAVIARYESLGMIMLFCSAGDDSRVDHTVAASELASLHSISREEAMAFIDAELECGLLSRPSGQSITFSMPHFQAWFAARALARVSSTEQTRTWQLLKDRISDELYAQVIGLFVPCLASLSADRAWRFLDYIAEDLLGMDLAAQARGFAVLARAVDRLQSGGLAIRTSGFFADLRSEMQRLYEAEAEAAPLVDRVAAAGYLGTLGDACLFSGMEAWVEIPEGTAIFGAQSVSPNSPSYDPMALPWEGPVRSLCVARFCIRRCPITVAEYAEFVAAGGYRMRALWSVEGWSWLSKAQITRPANWYRQLDAPNCPVTGVSWFEAAAFCRWMSRSEATGDLVRLPLSVEWEYVARRSPLAQAISKTMPWASVCDSGLVGNCSLVGLWQKSPVGIFPRSTSSDGVCDLFGNVEEWCHDQWPEEALDQEQEVDLGVDAPYGYKIVRGGSAIRVSRLCRPTYFSRCRAERQYPTLGFRAVKIRGEGDKSPVASCPHPLGAQ